jgi:2-polyprenyl-3-methyl-5-hydroxy-6-metoxy-1,4-benzoquinol methylase
VPSTTEYFDDRAGEYANIYGPHRSRLRALYFHLKWYPLHQTRKIVLKEIGSVSGLRVLDVGCGVGGYAIELARRGAQVSAIDVSASMLAIARQRAAEAGVGDRIEFVQADGRAWLAADPPGSPTGHRFDVAVGIGVFDYVDDPVAWLAELGRHCDRLIATFPRPSAFQSAITLRYRQIGVTARVYDIDELRAWLASAGYDAQRVMTPPLGGYLVFASRS